MDALSQQPVKSRWNESSSATTADGFLRQKGLTGIVSLAIGSYRRYQTSQGNREYPCAVVESSEIGIWSALQESEFHAAAEEGDPGVGVSGILPIRALMAARMADDSSRPLDQARELLQGTPLEAQVLESLTKRWSMGTVVKLTATPEAAIVVYTASVLALESPDHSYLTQMVEALKLPSALVHSVHDEVRQMLLQPPVYS